MRAIYFSFIAFQLAFELVLLLSVAIRHTVNYLFAMRCQRCEINLAIHHDSNRSTNLQPNVEFFFAVAWSVPDEIHVKIAQNQMIWA